MIKCRNCSNKKSRNLVVEKLVDGVQRGRHNFRFSGSASTGNDRYRIPGNGFGCGELSRIASNPVKVVATKKAFLSFWF